MSQVRLNNNPSRNGFDLSQKKNYSAKAGELLPIFFKPVLPGDSFKINVQSFTRTRPLNTAAYARMREYYDFYFVPAEVLWKHYKHVLTQMNENLQHASGPLLSDNGSFSGDLPYVTCEQVSRYISGLVDEDGSVPLKNSTLFGFSRAFYTVKLLSYLGYPDFSIYLDKSKTWDNTPMLFNEKLSVAPLLCYQKVYADYFRFTQWEKPNPSSFNVDYIKGTDDCNLNINGIEEDFNFFDLRFANYNKDLYFGLLPEAQYGDTAAAVTGDINGFYSFSGDNIPDGKPLLVRDNSQYNKQLKSSDGTFLSRVNISDSNGTSELSILGLRKAEMYQKWKEISQSVNQDYKDQVKAHWGVTVSDFLSDESRYLGGFAQSLDINSVTNTNLTGDGNTDIKGTGTFSSQGGFGFTSKGEYGFIIGVYHVTPLFDYTNGQSDPMCYLTNSLDYPIPEFDKIGMEQISISRLLNIPITGSITAWKDLIQKNPFIGYAPRYIHWKTDVDKSLGIFTTNSFKPWVIGLTAEDIINSVFSPNGDKVYDLDTEGVPGLAPGRSDGLRWNFFKVNPKVIDSLFPFVSDSSYDTDQFLISSFIDCKVVRSLDYDGLPY
nr:MAG: major capsid protein [Microvirus Sku18]